MYVFLEFVSYVEVYAVRARTKSRRGAVTTVKIARHYGANAMLFMGEEIPY